MNSDLLKFLNPLRDNTEYYTNGSQMIPNTGKFRIERENSESFWTLYQDLLFKLKDEFMAGLNERPKTFMPVLGDIDIALPYTDSEEDEKKLSTPLYNKKHVLKIVNIYIDVLKHVLDKYDHHHFYCFVLEKPTPYISGHRIKHGFHIHFPFLFLSNIDQDMHIIPRVRERVETEKVFEDIGILHSSDTIDKSCSRQHWLLYGSRKDTKLHAYTVTKIYNIKSNEVTLEEVMKHNKIYNTYEEEIELIEPAEYYLPRILSIDPLTRQTYVAKYTIKVIPKQELAKANESKRVIDNMTIPQIVKMANKLMPLIRDSRASDHNEKMEIGWILYNITDGSEEGLNMWLEFLQRDNEKYSEAKAVYRWTREIKKKNMTIGSLRYIARKDSPEKYEELNRDEQKDLIYKSLLGGHRDIAQQLYDKYNGQFVCADLEKKIWYEFREHRWVRVPLGVNLRCKITTDIIPIYVEETKRLLDISSKEDGNQNDSTNKYKQINKIIGCLKTSPFKDNIMKECQELFYKEDFLKNLDRNNYLLGFNNGVLDLKKKEFRAGRPDDYVSMTVGYDWEDFEEDDHRVYECKDFLLKLFPNPLIRRYAVEYFASILRGGNYQKTFVIMTGEGDNGKSVLIDFLEQALGDYMNKLPTSVITTERAQSSSSTMDLELLRNLRYAVLQETSKKDKINDGKLKELTGNDKFQSRGHYQGFSKVDATAKIALICNKLPSIGSDDPAIWNRVRILPFESKFPANNEEVPSTFEEQIKKKIFYRDNTISEKLPSLRQALIWYLFQRYIDTTENGFSKEPQQVIEATELYRKNNDVFLQFINERIVKDESDTCEGISLNDMFLIFKDWYRETFNSNNCPNKNDMKDDLFKKWGPSRSNKWKKYRIRTIRDDEEEGLVLALRDEDYEN